MTLAIFNTASLPSATPCAGILLMNSWLGQVVTRLECLNSARMSLKVTAWMGGSKVTTPPRIPQRLSSPAKHSDSHLPPFKRDIPFSTRVFTRNKRKTFPLHVQQEAICGENKILSSWKEFQHNRDLTFTKLCWEAFLGKKVEVEPSPGCFSFPSRFNQEDIFKYLSMWVFRGEEGPACTQERQNSHKGHHPVCTRYHTLSKLFSIVKLFPNLSTWMAQ